jgi:mRNA interferase YafQ
MLSIVVRNCFKREVALALRRGKDIQKLDEIIKRLAAGQPLDVRHRNHRLTGNYLGWLECHVEPDWLLIYQTTATELVLYRTGSHSDLFR